MTFPPGVCPYGPCGYSLSAGGSVTLQNQSILYWNLGLETDQNFQLLSPFVNSISTSHTFEGSGDSFIGGVGVDGSNLGDPGTWTLQAAPGPIPGAGLLSYLALGLLSLGSVEWKRFRQGPAVKQATENPPKYSRRASLRPPVRSA
jgi:hypothetical protein